ncbi:MAG: DUF1109 domain-containing protein [Pseudomonadota bacterium]
MKTDDLIARLAREPSKISSQLTARNASLGLLIAIPPTMALSILLYGVRSDGPTSGLIGLAVWTLLAIISLAAATRMRLPEPPRRLMMLAPFAGLAGVLAVLAMVAAAEGAVVVRVDHILHCLQTVGLLAVLPFIGASIMLRRGAPASPLVAGAYAGLFAGAVGALAYSISCPINDPLASLSAHTITVLIIAAIGSVIGSKLFSW